MDLDGIKKNKTFIILLLIVLIGSSFRLYEWHKKSLWQDELYTVASAVGVPLYETTMNADNEVEIWGETFDSKTPIKPAYYTNKLKNLKPTADFWEHLKRNIQAPLYPLIIRAKIELTGNNNPVHHRTISIIFGILSIPLAYLLGKSLKDELLGLLLAGVVSLSGFLIVYSQTARLYSMLFFILVLFLTFTVRLHQNNKSRHVKGLEQTAPQWKNWLGFGLSALLGLYTHYYFALPVFYIGIILTLANRRDSEFLKQLWQVAGFVIMAYMPGLLLLQEQVQFMAELGDKTLAGTHLSLSLIERLWNTLTSLIAYKSIPLQILSTLIIIPIISETITKKQWKTYSGIAIGGILFFIFSLLFIDIMSNTHRIATKRYFIFAAPFVYYLFCWSIRWLILNIRLKYFEISHLFHTLAILFLANATFVASGEKFLKKEDYRSAGEYIHEYYQQDDLVLVSHSAVHAIGTAYYLPQDVDMQGINRRSWDKEALENHLQNITMGRQKVWVVFTHAPGNLKNTMKNWFKQNGEFNKTKKYSSIQVYHWSPQKPPSLPQQ